jgi:hypothetical protein
LEHKVPNEFVSLIRAATGLPISLPEFKLAVSKAIKEVMLLRQNRSDKVTEILSQGQPALINEEPQE